jgi:hypothetical protein
MFHQAIIQAATISWSSSLCQCQQTRQCMTFGGIIAVCSQIHTKHINTLCGQNVPRSKHTPSRL